MDNLSLRSTKYKETFIFNLTLLGNIRILNQITKQLYKQLLIPQIHHNFLQLYANY